MSTSSHHRRRRFRRNKKRPPVGARPGTLAISDASPPPKIFWTRYTESALDELEVTDVSVLDAALEPGAVSWIDVQGLGDETLLRNLGERFSIHPLALEDLAGAASRPKAESYDDQLLLITRIVRLEAGTEVAAEQVGIVVGRTYVLTFQERHADVFEPVRARVRAGRGPLRRSGADYLAYALFDLILDAFFPVAEALGDELEVLEDMVMTQPGSETLRRLNHARASLLILRRAISPQRETVNRLLRDDTPLIGDAVRVYLRDLHDHCVQIAEAVESGREMASGLMNTYLSVVGQRTNDVMKVLTIVASIFVPLTFMAGIYGMNFENMPELAHPWGYPALLVAMAVLGIGMILYFRRKGWIGSDDEGL